MTGPVWDDGSWKGLAPLDEDVSADVCVVGLGGSGLAAIHELIAAGASVVGLDAGPVAGGAAGRNGGFLLAGLAAFHHDAVARYGRERAVRAYQLTLAEIDRIEAETPDLVRRTGSLRVAAGPGEDEDLAAHLAAMRADGLPVDEYEGPEGRGLRFPRDAAYNPLARARLLAQEATVSRSVRLHEHSPAGEIGTHKVRTARGYAVRCGAVLVLVDGGLAALAPALAGRVRTARLEMLATEPTTEVEISMPVYARYGFDYWQQTPDHRVAVGGGRDLFLDESWSDDATPTDDVQGHLDGLLRAIGVRDASVTHRWAASAGFTPDLLPVVEELVPDVWVAGGYSGTGNVVGALCGRGLAQVATTGATELLP